MAMLSVNPATGEQLASYDELSLAQLEQALGESSAAFASWRATPFKQRAPLMHNAAAVLRKNQDAYARILTLEMGKPITQSLAEIEKCALNCDYYADNAERFLADVDVASNAAKSYVSFEPLGAVLAIMPWNFPFWQVFRFAAPTLMGGNTAVLKHASNVPQCSLAIELVFRETGFPDGVFAPC